MLNKRDDGAKMVYSEDIARVDVGDTITWVPTSKGHNVQFVTVPEGATILSSNQINKIQGLNFKINSSNVWGIQYHPEIPYEKMIRLIHFRKERLLEKKAFKSGDEIVTNVKSIEDEITSSNKELRMKELYNWINYLNEN